MGWTPPELSLLEAESWDEIKVIVLPYGSFLTLDENGLWIPFSQVDERVFNYDLLYQYSDQKDKECEKYIAPLYDHLLSKGGQIYICDIKPEKVHVLGTPEELRIFLGET